MQGNHFPHLSYYRIKGLRVLKDRSHVFILISKMKVRGIDSNTWLSNMIFITATLIYQMLNTWLANCYCFLFKINEDKYK